MHIHFLKEPAIDRKLQPLQREIHARANEEVLVRGQRRVQARHVATLERLRMHMRYSSVLRGRMCV